MKKLALLVVGIVALIAFGAGVGKIATDRYREHKNQTQAHAVQYVTKADSDQQVQNVKTAAAGEYQSLVDQYNRQTAECQKGTGAYALLTTAQKAKVVAPACLPAQQ